MACISRLSQLMPTALELLDSPLLSFGSVPSSPVSAMEVVPKPSLREFVQGESCFHCFPCLVSSVDIAAGQPWEGKSGEFDEAILRLLSDNDVVVHAACTHVRVELLVPAFRFVRRLTNLTVCALANLPFQLCESGIVLRISWPVGICVACAGRLAARRNSSVS